jgi:GGDEF domain-containing protein
MSPSLKASLLAAGCALVGGLAALAGGFFAALAAAVVLGAGVWLFLNFPKKKKTVVAAAPVPSAEGIPEDRVDSLTGLPNQNGLDAWFAENLSTFTPEDGGLLVMTAALDDLAGLRRSRGQAIADLVLKEVAKRVLSSVGDDGVAARTSDTEFVGVLRIRMTGAPELAAEEAGKLADLLQRPAELTTGVVWIGGSVGAAVGMPAASAAILANSRQATAQAIRLGRGHYFVHSAVAAR